MLSKLLYQQDAGGVARRRGEQRSNSSSQGDEQGVVGDPHVKILPLLPPLLAVRPPRPH